MQNFKRDTSGLENITEQQLMDFIKMFGLELFAEQEMNAIRGKIDSKIKGINGLESLLDKLNNNSYFKKMIEDSSFTT